MKRYHLLAITEEQRKSLLAALEDCGGGGDDVYFLEKTLKSMNPTQLNEIADLESGYFVKTTRDAEAEWLEKRIGELKPYLQHHTWQAELLEEEGYTASAECSRANAKQVSDLITEFETRLGELRNGL